MRLILYSGGEVADSDALNKEVLRIIGKKRPSFTFIPANFDESQDEFEGFIEDFSFHGVSDFLKFSIDQPFSPVQMRKALRRDFIFLGGGNTFLFLKSLRQSGMVKLLKDYVRGGGVLGGMSAGSILITPSIDTASFPSFDRDDNRYGMKKLNALGLTNFEFFPHYKNTQGYIRALRDYTLTSRYPLYACPDGSGIVVEDNSVQFIGKSWGYSGGELFRIVSSTPRL